ncbi:MAG: archaemetzincin family Zn-dependent metalloprotease [Candidatus Scalindua sp.]|nr:archaemetzincin family Zn-dependent metalloprotease [Candidatus Scalindua sp.]
MKSKMRDFRKCTILFLLLFFFGAILIKSGYTGKKEMEEKICLVQIGDVDERIMLYMKIVIEGIFGKKIDTVSLPHDRDYAYNKSRKQYCSSKILQELRKLELSDYESALAIIDVDLYVPELTFVFGEADLKNKVSIISLTRLRQEFYNLPANISLFNERIITEAVHELGHTYGLRHCQYGNCVMFFSRTLSDTDKKGSGFCDVCEKKLQRRKKFVR